MQQNQKSPSKPRLRLPKPGKNLFERLGFTWTVIRILILLLLLAAVTLTIYIYKVASTIEGDLPDLTKQIKPAIGSQIFDSENKLIGTYYLHERYYVKLSNISPEFLTTIVDAEDERFYQHRGFDIKAIIRAFVISISKGFSAPGASTITQQLARSQLFLDASEVTIERKIKEIILAFRLEKKYSKDDILEFYVNQIFFGFGSYGVEAAARNYFGKHASELNYPESAMLCGILTAPSVDNPKVSMDAAKKKQYEVLIKLQKNGHISAEDVKKYYDLPIPLKSFRDYSDNDSINYVVDYIRFQMEQRFKLEDIQTGGFKIYTTINRNYQKNAETIINQVLEKAEKNNILATNVIDEHGVKQPQACLIALETKTGKVLTMIGGRNYKNAQFNRTLSLRHPGSSFKVYDYTASIDNHCVTPGSLLVSEDFEVNGWGPGEWEFTGGFFGKQLVQGALIKSSNICALRASLRVGIDRVAYYAAKMGLKTDIEAYPSITVGSVDIRPIDQATGYSVLGAMGIRHDPWVISEIRNSNDVLIERYSQNDIRVIPESTAWLVGRLFRTVLEVNQSAYGVTLKCEGGGKTGTSTKAFNGWYCCFTPEITVVSYVGKDSQNVDTVFKGGVNWGSAFAAPIVLKFINACINDPKTPLPKGSFPPAPTGEISWMHVCKTSGQLATEFCPKEVTIGFDKKKNKPITEQNIYDFPCLKGTEPSQLCVYHYENAHEYDVVVEYNSLGNEIYFKPGSGCQAEKRKIRPSIYAKLQTKECASPVVITDINGQSIPQNIEVSSGDTIALNISIKSEYFGKIDEIDIYYKDVRVKRIKQGDIDLDSNLTINLDYSQNFTFIPEESGILVIEMRGHDLLFKETRNVTITP